MRIRAAEPDDVVAMGRLADRKRRQYAAYQPVFWRLAPSARTHHERFLARLVADPEVLSLVATLDEDVHGFVVGRLVDAAPVYDPGGPSVYVDDFVVSREAEWATVGAALLRSVRQLGVDRGAAQVVVVSGALDTAKRRLLADADLEVASEWWVAPLPRGSSGR